MKLWFTKTKTWFLGHLKFFNLSVKNVFSLCCLEMLRMLRKCRLLLLIKGKWFFCISNNQNACSESLKTEVIMYRPSCPINSQISAQCSPHLNKKFSLAYRTDFFFQIKICEGIFVEILAAMLGNWHKQTAIHKYSDLKNLSEFVWGCENHFQFCLRFTQVISGPF